jgi:hypothetical protein
VLVGVKDGTGMMICVVVTDGVSEGIQTVMTGM